MTYIEDYGLETPVRKFLVLALHLKDRLNQKSMDNLHIQKTINYFEYLRQKTEINFSNYKLGGVSYELEENLETLLEGGLVTKTDHKFILSIEGEKAAKELLEKTEVQEMKKLEFSKHQLNDLTSDETMFFMYNLLPETQKNSTEIVRLNKKKKELIENLFTKGRINSETAAKWMGVRESDIFNAVKKR